MMLFALTLEVNAIDWDLSFPQGSLTDWDTFHQAFDKRWSMVKEGIMLLDNFQEAKKTYNENFKRVYTMVW